MMKFFRFGNGIHCQRLLVFLDHDILSLDQNWESCILMTGLICRALFFGTLCPLIYWKEQRRNSYLNICICNCDKKKIKGSHLPDIWHRNSISKCAMFLCPRNGIWGHLVFVLSVCHCVSLAKTSYLACKLNKWNLYTKSSEFGFCGHREYSCY